MDITLNKVQVFKDVKMNVSVIARDEKADDGSPLYDKLRIEERDEPMLDTFWNSSLSCLLTEISIFNPSIYGTAITLEVHRYNPNSISDLPILFNNYLMNKIIESWLSSKSVNYASIYNAKAAENIASIKERLFNRVEPEMKKFGKVEPEPIPKPSI